MQVLVDTSVWSLALRRRHSPPRDAHLVAALTDLIGDCRVALIGPIRQEVLSGISDGDTFERLQERLAIFPDEPIRPQEYVNAVLFANVCRRHGVQGSATDFLICAVAANHTWPILTTDRDFARFAKHIPITLYRPAKNA